MLVASILIALAFVAGWALRGLWEERGWQELSCRCGAGVKARWYDREFLEDWRTDHDGPGHSVEVEW